MSYILYKYVITGFSGYLYLYVIDKENKVVKTKNYSTFFKESVYPLVNCDPQIGNYTS